MREPARVALGSGSQSRRRAAEDLLRRRESRHRAFIRARSSRPSSMDDFEALDAETGKTVWEARVVLSSGQLHDHDGAAHRKRKVIIGVAAASFRFAVSSRPTTPIPASCAWRFYTVPGDPSKPFENAAMKKAAETWDGDWWKFGGGGTVWDGIAYDPGSRSGLRRHRQRRAVAGRASQVQRQRQPVRVLDPGGEARYRRTEVVLPESSRRFLGLRQRAEFMLADVHDQRPARAK